MSWLWYFMNVQEGVSGMRERYLTGFIDKFQEMMPFLPLNFYILELPLWRWFFVFLFIILGLLGRRISQIIIKRLKKIASKTKMKWDDKILKAIEKPLALLVTVDIWYFGFFLFSKNTNVYEIGMFIFQGIFSYGIIWALYNSTSLTDEFLTNLAKTKDFPIDKQLIPIISNSLKILVLVIGLLIVIQNYGIQVGSLIAGLGIGGLAFALAFKDTAANLFGSIMILADRPFKVDDWIVVGSHEGMVEIIGLRSTRIRTFYDSQISIPNSVLANEKIDNMGRRKYRRVYENLGITYQTPASKVEMFIEGIKEIIIKNEKTRKDYFLVNFNKYNDSSLNIMVYFFVNVPNWIEEMNTKQEIFLAIYQLAEKIGVSFAYPTQTLHLAEPPFPYEKMMLGKVPE